MKISIILFLSLFSYTLLLGQGHNEDDNSKDSIYHITGTVTDTTGLPLAGVTIFINKRKFFTQSRLDGSFMLSLPVKFRRKNFNVYAASVGYDRLTVKINNKNGVAQTQIKMNLIFHDFSKDPLIYIR